jgi:hypothetical protein
MKPISNNYIPVYTSRWFIFSLLDYFIVSVTTLNFNNSNSRACEAQPKPHPTPHNHWTPALSNEKIKPPKRYPKHPNPNLILAGNRNSIVIAHHKTVPIKQLTTEPNRSQTRTVSTCDFLKQFDEITQVYQQSRSL